jgi:hypothetical protein
VVETSRSPGEVRIPLAQAQRMDKVTGQEMQEVARERVGTGIEGERWQ